jgi:Ca-activated chloride channel family protein
MRRQIILSVVLSFLIAGSACADGVIVVPSPPRGIPFIPLSIKYHHVEVDIDNQIATTKVDQVFTNENDRELEGIYIFPIPEAASISDFAMYVDGKRVSADILEKKKAREIYEDIVRRMRDPALLEYMGRNAFKASIYPIPARGEKRVQLEYSELLKYDSGLCKYVYPLNTEKFSAKPIQSVSVSVKIKSSKPIKSVYSPSHDIDVHKETDHTAKLGYEASNVKPDRDLVMYYTVSDKDFGLNLLAHREEDEDGFFILLIAPKHEIASDEVIEKDIIFVLDKSGSMKNDNKLGQAKGALKFCISSLNEGDKFGIISFSTDVVEFDSSLLAATSSNVRTAIKFIDRLEAKGGTNIDGALQTALKKDSDAKRPRIIVFLTDGLPTVGERNVDTILSNVEKARDGSARFFTFGVGYDVNTHFLDKLAQNNGGAPQYVEPSEDIEVAVSLFYDKISEPVLSDLELDTGTVKAKEVYPKNLPDLFKGSQLVVMGRYEGEGEADVKLEGHIQGKKHAYKNKADFPRRSSANDFIPRLWAQRKVGYLLDEIRSHGDDSELKDEIIRLSKKYGIITPYTSFLVLPDEEAERVPVAMRGAVRRDALDRASSSLRMKETGAQAVEASERLYALKKANAAPAAPMVAAKPVGGSGDGGKYAEVKYVGKKTFFFKNGFWTDSEYEPEMETTRIAYGSDEYFRLLSQEPELGKYLALGKKIIVCYKGKCYKIEE